jgi:hypothetical protein
MQDNQFYLIVKKPTLMKQWYSMWEQDEKFRDGIKRIRAALPFSNPENYRGISRAPLFPFWTSDIKALREVEPSDIEVNTAARIKMAELAEAQPTDQDTLFVDGMLEHFEQALEIYHLLDGNNKKEYEIIRITKNSVDKLKDTLGYDIGYWGGDYFSIICDCAIMPLWHPPALTDLQELAEQLQTLNGHLLFNTIAEGENFRKYYKSKSWAETESEAGEFCIIRVDECPI